MKKYLLQIQEKEYPAVDHEDGTISINGKRFEADSLKQHRTYMSKVAENQFEVWIKNYCIPLTIVDEKSLLLSKVQKNPEHKYEQTIKAPMPGLVVAVEVQVGEIVAPGIGLIVLEAMKMENEIRSQLHARVTKIDVEKSSRVEKGQTLIHLEPVE